MSTYLPVLLVSVTTNAYPDDSSFDTVPRGQVDYLSHQWREEDVWRSWRSMTKQRNAIANGARLENASWRTWWKQRNRLKTISPETLNWLKDSDVTWLYGPLHTGVDWSPPPKDIPKEPDPLSSRSRRGSTSSLTTIQRQGSSTSISGKKPILKHRSIGELLSLPQSPHFSPNDIEEARALDLDFGSQGTSTDTGLPSRPPLLHTKSDTHIVRLKKNHQEFRKDSPPRIIASDSKEHSFFGDETQSTSTKDGASDVSSSAADTPGSDNDSHAPSTGKKKHISFNTFVEQCISIEKPNLTRNTTSGSGRSGRFLQSHPEDGYDEEAEMEDVHYEDFYDEPSWFPRGRNSSESDEEDDEVLEMRTSSSRSRSSSSSKHPSTRPPLVRLDSLDKERVTIAPIAPTMLKTTGGNSSEYDSNSGSNESSPRRVELVYVPPLGRSYNNSTSNSRSVSRRSSAEDVYQHNEAFLSVGTGSQSSSSVSSPSGSPVSSIPSVGFVSSSQPRPVFHSPGAESPPHESRFVDGAEVDAYDYFEGADFGEDYAAKRVRFPRGPRVVHDGGERAGGALRHTNVPSERSDVRTDEEVVEERREHLISPSPTSPMDAPTPKQSSHPVPVPHVSSAHAQPTSPNLLSPPDIVSSRGRTPAVASSVPNGLSESRSDSRGRSVTRSSSFSDRGRSGSRSSRGADSPMGSISPCGSSAAVAVSQPSYGREQSGHDGRGGSSYPPISSRTGSDDSTDGRERGRDRTGRRLSESLSPPITKEVSSPPPKPPVIFMPPSIPEENEQRSRNPTPANSPVQALKFANSIPSANPAFSNRASSSSTPLNRSLSPPTSQITSPVSPSGRRFPENPDGTFVGRAVSSAKEFLGTFWSPTPPS